MIDYILFLTCGLLWYLGGQINHNIRRIPIPIILALYLACALKTWWLFLACGIGYGLTIPIGYGEPTADDPKPSFLGKIFKVGWLIRGIYGLIVACFGALGLVLGHFLAWPAYLLYLALNFAIGAILVKFKAPDYIIEPFIGLGIGSIIFLVK